MGIVLILISACIAIGAPQWAEYRLTTSPADQSRPDIDGNIVAWEDSRNVNIDIYAADITDLNNPIEFRISSNSVDEVSPKVCGYNIFYIRKTPYTHIPPILYTYEIYMYNIDTGSTTLIAGNSISGGTLLGADESTVVWREWGGPLYLYAYDIPTKSVFPINQISTASADVSGNKIVWKNSEHIYGFNLDSWDTFPIETDTTSNGNPAISGVIVVWLRLSDIYGADISDIHNVIKFPICTESHNQSWPVISGYNIVWGDNRNGNNDIYGYNLLTQNEFIVTDNSASQTFPAINGNTVVWQDSRNGHYDIYATVIYGQQVPICMSPLQGDLNNDCKVDFADFSTMIEEWLECNLDPPSACWQ
ncbi:MAG: hypothetical protein ABII09_09305 [Planctomycetota bacterium]